MSQPPPPTGTEVFGKAVRSILAGMMAIQSRAERMLAANGISPLTEDRWYPLERVAEEASAGSEAAARKERMKERTPRVDGAELLKRTFDFDVFACVRCGGRRRVLAYVKAGRGVRAILEHLGLATAGVSLAPAQESTQAAWC